VECTVHRGTHEIGGSCVELRAQGKSLLLDIGMPLVNEDGTRFTSERLDRPVDELVQERLLPDIPGLYGDGPCNVLAIIVSHSHLDHYGLGHFARADVPVYVTKGTKAVLDINSIFLPNAKPLKNAAILPDAWQDFDIGPFTVRAWPVDHSAADAVAFEVVADGKKVFYSGDLRGHGWKHRLFDHMLSHPPSNVDVMLMEGSSIGRVPTEYPYPTEEAVLEALVETIAGKENLALLFCSSQNLDRLVTAYKAARRAKRLLVIDLYTAYVLHELSFLSGNLPQWNWRDVRVKFWKHQQDALERSGHEGFVRAIMRSKRGIKMEEVMERRCDILMLAKSNRLFRRIVNPARLTNYEGLKLIWSMWHGYLEDDRWVKPFCDEHGLELKEIHSSGHATVEDLERLVQAIQPKRLVPIHTFYPEDYDQFGVEVRRLQDGEALTL